VSKQHADRRRRVLVALAIGATAGLTSYAFLDRPGFSSDYFHVWAGAKTLLAGGNPYKLTPTGPHNPGATPLFYPLPALLLIVPFAYLDLAVSGGLFVGISSAALAYLVTRGGYHRLPLFMSAPFLMAVSLGQWSPLVAAAALEPNLGFALAAKPNLGVAAWVYRPSIRAIVGGLLLTLASLAVLPSWPLDWLHNISGRPEKSVPILTAIGPLVALGLVRWRSAEGRFYVALGTVPQALFFYDQLLLWLLPRTLRQSLLMSLASFGIMLTWYHRIQPDDYYVQTAAPYALSLYLPALIVLLWPRAEETAHTSPSGPGEAHATQPVQ
jgi:hypothetical protein